MHAQQGSTNYTLLCFSLPQMHLINSSYLRRTKAAPGKHFEVDSTLILILDIHNTSSLTANTNQYNKIAAITFRNWIASAIADLSRHNF